MIKRSIDARLLQFRTLIANAVRHPKISQRMELYGYTKIRMQEVQDLLDQFMLWQAEMTDCYSQSNALKTQRSKEVKALKALYIDRTSGYCPLCLSPRCVYGSATSAKRLTEKRLGRLDQPGTQLL